MSHVEKHHFFDADNFLPFEKVGDETAPGDYHHPLALPLTMPLAMLTKIGAVAAHGPLPTSDCLLPSAYILTARATATASATDVLTCTNSLYIIF